MLAIQNFYCTELHVFLNIVINIGTTWFANVLGVESETQATPAASVMGLRAGRRGPD